jgi:hypothetical protein
VLIVEGVILVASVAAVTGLVGWPFGRGTTKGLVAAAAGLVVAGLMPPGVERLGGALLTYAVALVVLRPVPAAMCMRLLRGALGRPGPPSPAGIG